VGQMTRNALDRAALGDRAPRCVEGWTLEEAPYVGVSDAAGWVRIRFRTSAGHVRSSAMSSDTARRLAISLMEAADIADQKALPNLD